MSVSDHSKRLLTGVVVIAVVAVTGWKIEAQGGGQVQRNPCAECGTPVNDAPNPYRTIENFFKLPAGATARPSLLSGVRTLLVENTYLWRNAPDESHRRVES